MVIDQQGMIEHAVDFRIIARSLGRDEVVRTHGREVDHPLAVIRRKLSAQQIVQLKQRVNTRSHRLQLGIRAAAIHVDAGLRRTMHVHPLQATPLVIHTLVNAML